MNSFNNLKYKKYCLLLLAFFFTAPSLASVCFIQISVKIYESSSVSDDFNNDGIIDEFVIAPGTLPYYPVLSVVRLSADGQALSNTYEIDESWADSASWSSGVPLSTSGIPTSIISFDANNDGFKDIVAALGSRIVIRLNDKSGGFKDAPQFLNLSDLYGIDESLVSELQAHNGAELTILDLNQDGFEDLGVVFAEGLSIFMNDASGSFYHQKNQNIAGFLGEDLTVYVSDLDADLLSEIVISNTAGTKVVYFSEGMSIDIISLSNLSDWLSTVDFDNDGDLDFLEREFFDFCSVPSIEPKPSTYWINNGNGVFDRIVIPASGYVINPIIEFPTITIVDPIIEEPVVEIQSIETNNRESGGGGISFQYLLIPFILLYARSFARVPVAKFPQKKKLKC